MSDLISRHDAIDALKKYEEIESNNFTDTSPISMMTVGTIANCIEANVDLPSAEPERRWIPVTEALPEECVNVLIQMDDGEMAVSQRRDVNYWDGYGRCGDIIAWMPLPEPWRGE